MMQADEESQRMMLSPKSYQRSGNDGNQLYQYMQNQMNQKVSAASKGTENQSSKKSVINNLE